MGHSLYNEVTAVTGVGYPTNRVLGKLKTASLNLPYSLEDIKISHNDFAVTEVYNDSIRKLYRNYLYLIANAEIVTTSSPTSAVGSYINVDPNFNATLSSTSTNPASGNSLSSMHGNIETHIAKKLDSNHFVYFTYSTGDSVVVESTTQFGTVKSVLSGNFVEYSPDDNNTFKFKNIVSVDIVDEYLFVLDRGNLTLFKFDISGLITNDSAVRRTGINDTDNPGHLLLKTLGGTQYTQVKNKLVDPVSLSVHNKKLYVLDNGTRSIKIYDLNFNYLNEIKHGPLYDNVQNDIPVSLVIDQLSDTNKTIRGYILTSKGRIFEYDPVTNIIGSPVSLFESYLPYEIYVFNEDRKPPTLDQIKLYKPEGSNFKKIVNSKSSKNILYVASNRNIYKLYKSNLNTPITVLDFNTSTISDGNTRNAPVNITTDFRDISSQTIASFDTVLHDGYDYMAVTTTTLSSITEGVEVSGYKTSTYLFTDKNITTKLYNDSFYTNYFTLSDIYVLPQEIVNNITFNKTTKKLIYNHYSLFENLNKKIYTYFTKANLGTSIVPAICTINSYGFEKPSALNNNDEFYIGVNEPLLTDVVNRPIELLYKQQEALFSLIKEDQLNTDPPSGVNTRLPSKGELATSVVSLDTTSVTVTGGDLVSIGISRRNLISVENNSCSIYFYTTLGTGDEYSFEYISEINPSTAVFAKGVTDIVIEIDTAKFFAKDGAGNVIDENKYNTDQKANPLAHDKTFTFKIKAGSNCIIDEDDVNSVKECTVTIKPDFDKYNITLFGVESFTNRTTTGDGYTARVGVQRKIDKAGVTAVDYSLSAACNIWTNPVNWPAGMKFIPHVPDRPTYSVYSTDKDTGKRDAKLDFPPVPGGTDVPNQVSAAQLPNTSTIFFTPGVSSIIFDLSAQEIEHNGDINSDSAIDIIIQRPTANAIINKSNPLDYKKTVSLKDTYKTINLFVSSISADYRVDGSTTNNLLSCVNVWDALIASNASDHVGSNTFDDGTDDATYKKYPISACFTIQDSVSIISTDDTLPAVYFKPPNDFNFVYTNNQIDIVIKSNNSIVGKGGKGGHGLAAEDDDGYGTRFDGEEDPVHIGETGDVDDVTTHTGTSGGPALSGFDAYFKQKILITNNGKVYGGAGGGGGGLPGVSALNMPEHTWPLWFGCGGGGGGGIHSKNVGAGGSAAMKAMNSPDTEAVVRGYLQDGSTGGTEMKGGAGGTWDETATGWPSITLRKAKPAGNDEVALTKITDTVTDWHAVTGNPGGNIGEPGKSDGTVANYYTLVGYNIPVNDQGVSPFPDNSYNNVLDNYRFRVGGAAGNIITPLQWTTSNSTIKVPVTAGTGSFHGTGNFETA